MFFQKISLPVQLLVVIGVVICFGSYFPANFTSFLYTFSLVFKEFLGFFLPFIVFAFILNGILSFKKNAPLVLSLVLTIIVASNFLVAFIAFLSGKLLVPVLTKGLSATELVVQSSIKPWFSFSIPHLIGAEQAMVAAIVLGLFFSYKRVESVIVFSQRFKKFIETVLNKGFIPLLPFYVFGFLLRLHSEGTFYLLFKSYGSAYALIISMHISYLTLMYFSASGFHISQAIEAIKNAIPAYLTAFSTMSSTATIPVTINGVTKNTGNRSLASMAVPIMANVHLLGDAITTPILTLMTMSIFFGQLPDLFLFMKFICFFCMTMLAASGVPGGGIIVVLPLLKSFFHFTPSMISIVTTLYLLQDSFGTAGNVTGDGALCIFVHKMLKKFGIET